MENFLNQIDFGNEAADDIDPEELSNFFIEQNAFKKFIDIKNKILSANAKKV